MSVRRADLQTRLEALGKCFVPDEEDNNLSTIAKITTLIFVTGWVVIFVAMTLKSVPTINVDARIFGTYSAIVFYILGQMHDLELKKLLGR